MAKYSSRALISFEGRCPLNCKHCYTFDLDPQPTSHDISEIIANLAPKDCNIIYVSQRYENFYDESEGYSLCNELYTNYRKDIFIITRSYLSDQMIENLSSLNQRMQKAGNTLILAVSVCANTSYSLTENPDICPTPAQRMQNLKRVHKHGIKTILMIRPVFPNSIIPIAECTSLISQYSQFIDAVVTSGLIVTDRILKRLNLDKNSLSYLVGGDSTYLADLKGTEVMYVDVEAELQEIEHSCVTNKIPCFRHSMPALNAIVD